MPLAAWIGYAMTWHAFFDSIIRYIVKAVDQMQWNSDKANEYFSKKYYALNPDQYYKTEKTELFKRLYDMDVALKDFYKLCMGKATTRFEILATLREIVDNPDVRAPRKVNDKTRYINALKNEANRVLEEIEGGILEFNNF